MLLQFSLSTPSEHFCRRPLFFVAFYEFLPLFRNCLSFHLARPAVVLKFLEFITVNRYAFNLRADILPKHSECTYVTMQCPLPVPLRRRLGKLKSRQACIRTKFKTYRELHFALLAAAWGNI